MRTRLLARACRAFLAVILAAVSLWGQKTAHVEVNLKEELAVVPPAGYGVGMSVYDNDFISPGLVGRLKAAGVAALRFPGGSYADAYRWKTNSATKGVNLYIHPDATFDHFMNRNVLPSGTQAIVTVSYGSNAQGNGGGDPAEAADWVRYANVEKGWNIRHWEI